jgi:hypothetical protein
MKKFKEKNYKTSYLLAIQMHPKNNKPGQNQIVTSKPCILMSIKTLGREFSPAYSEILLCAKN